MIKSTMEIENEMNEKESLDEVLEVLNKNSIGEHAFEKKVKELCAKYEVTLAELQRNVAVSKTLFYAVLKENRQATKETVLKIAITLGVNREEINELLKLAKHKELYVKNKEDAIILFCLKQKMDIYEMDELLKKNNSKIRLLDEE